MAAGWPAGDVEANSSSNITSVISNLKSRKNTFRSSVWRTFEVGSFAGNENAFSVWSDEGRVSGRPTFSNSYYKERSWDRNEQEFTATQPGVYVFTLTATKSQSTDDLVLELVRRCAYCGGGESNKRGLRLYHSDGEHGVGSVTVLWWLSTGDTVSVEYERGAAYCTDEDPCVFSGFLLSWVQHTALCSLFFLFSLGTSSIVTLLTNHRLWNCFDSIFSNFVSWKRLHSTLIIDVSPSNADLCIRISKFK